MRVDIRVQEETFSLDAELARLADAGLEMGGIGAFVGVVRGDAGLAALVLEHYPGMTESMIARIVDQAGSRFGLLACTVVHRVGRLPVGAPIVLVLCAAAHRGAALDATGFVIDWLKTQAPFWKREEYPDGQARWVAARPSDEEAAARWGTAGPAES
ncbi:molybdopterin converting factor large subunit MoeE [Gluconacetobacter sacchari DSM 12717]|uniref:Molybdopterin synthase catalytic subunit n=2 Tax=Gluconacetobacter sacchari TaxID=92759 RepID=A0A7W4IF47_9PROT|nr:molybdenum cofactor biosynthesis protein MoaE [Gluconacetobacter sacchari]MBB2161720.1 molybdopterin synthase catalytic subunit [Gluconacetobacter sacchari]GBQ29493.1 molybdopterin converting factor large subunit MoeE [Gluconacetobacter sacchari DSM 12717]